MARFYGDTRDFIDKATHIAAQASIALDMVECRYCKAAQTRAMNKVAGCKAHRNAQRLAYLTSPVSETYWAS